MTLTVTSQVAAFASEASEQVRIPLATLQLPCVVVADTKVRPPGSGSLRMTFAAAFGPALATVRVHESGCATVGTVVWTFVIERFAVVFPVVAVKHWPNSDVLPRLSVAVAVMKFPAPAGNANDWLNAALFAPVVVAVAEPR